MGEAQPPDSPGPGLVCNLQSGKTSKHLNVKRFKVKVRGIPTNA